MSDTLDIENIDLTELESKQIIKNLKEKLHKAYIQNDFMTDDEVLAVSQKLDKYVVEYYKENKNKKPDT